MIRRPRESIRDSPDDPRIIDQKWMGYDAPALMLMAGLPRSGKSTFARSRCIYPIVSPDAIRKVVHGQPYVQDMEPLIWGMARIMVMALFECGHKTVVLDACSTTAERRQPWKDLCERHGWTYQVNLVMTPAAECIRRARESGQDYLVPVIERMAMETDIPQISSNTEGVHNS